MPFNRIDAAVAIVDPLDDAREVREPLAGQDLPGGGLRAQSRGEVQGTATVAVADRHSLTDVESDPDREWRAGAGDRFLEQAVLDGDRSLDGLSGEAKTASASSPRSSTTSTPGGVRDRRDALGEGGRQRGSGLVAVILGERRVTADVRDEEGADHMGGRVGAASPISALGAYPPRAAGSPLRLPHGVEYRARIIG